MAYVIAPMTTFTSLPWSNALSQYPEWYLLLKPGVEGIVQVITMAVLCIFAAKISPEQWELGANHHQRDSAPISIKETPRDDKSGTT